MHINGAVIVTADHDHKKEECVSDLTLTKMMQGTQNSALSSVGLQCLLFLRQNCFPQEKTKSTTPKGTKGRYVCMKENECT